MASEAPDPSSSELLTDFDIADVDNWDDQNDSSKGVELAKPSIPVISSPTITQITSSNQRPMVSLSNTNLGSPALNMANLEQLKKLASTLVKPGSPSSVPGQQSMTGHDYAKNANPSHNVAGVNQSKSPAENSLSKPTQPGQALETLRALALAQEEQARKLKEEQERQSQLQKESQGQKLSDMQKTSIMIPQGGQVAGPSSKHLSIPITTLKLPVSDSKGQSSSKNNSVLQLRGQLVRTPDQKLMLVTEVAGKKVGYLISPQSGQLQSAGATITSQVPPKTNQGNSQPQSPLAATTIVSTIAASSSPIALSPSSTPSHKPASPEYTGTALHTIKDVADENCNMQEEPLQIPVEIKKQESVTISSDEDDDSTLSEVAASLQNTHLQAPATIPVEKKKRGRGKAKKKRDKNEPVKPISPYLMFFKDVQPTVRRDNPGAGLGEVSKMISKLWEQASKEDKQVYLDRSEKAKEEYKIKLAEYKASIGETPGHQSLHSNAGAASVDMECNDQTTNDSLTSVDSLNTSMNSVEEVNEKSALVIVSSSDSSPEKTTNTDPETPVLPTEAQPPIETNDKSMEIETAQMTEPSPVRKRGRPKTKNKPDLKLTKEPKKSKKKEKLAIMDSERPKSLNSEISTPLDPAKPTPKLTMKINIRDSKITESPTKALEDLSKKITDDSGQDEEEHEHEEEEEKGRTEEAEASPTQPKPFTTFKIPLKKNRSSSSLDSKEGSSSQSDVDNRQQKATVPTARKCANTNCEKAAKISKERGPLYCSNKCLVEHCRTVFDSWVDERKQE